MHYFLLAGLLTQVRDILTTQTMATSDLGDSGDVPHMIGGRGRSAVMILMKRYAEEEFQYECAGTIISEKHILAAAQCVYCVDKNDCDQNVTIGDITVVANENDMD